MKGSLVIIAFFLLGILCSVFRIVPATLTESDVSWYALALLMFLVGMTIGSDSGILKKFRSLPPRLMLLPLLTIAGTLAGSAAASAVLPSRPLAHCLAVGSGMGYYSLSSIFITESVGAELGTVALMSNILREIATLLLAPLLLRLFGPLAPITSGGATTMDTTLPVITRTSGERFAILSIFHGFVTDFSVPFLVSFFCSV